MWRAAKDDLGHPSSLPEVGRRPRGDHVAYFNRVPCVLHVPRNEQPMHCNTNIMLVSPIRVHDILTGILETNEEDGPHTALLITPPGELISYSTLPEDIDGEESLGDAEEDDADGNGDGDGDDGDDDSDDEEEEPYLEGPERLRLLLGLASQWEDDESPRVECEVSVAE